MNASSSSSVHCGAAQVIIRFASQIDNRVTTTRLAVLHGARDTAVCNSTRAKWTAAQCIASQKRSRDEQIFLCGIQPPYDLGKIVWPAGRGMRRWTTIGPHGQQTQMDRRIRIWLTLLISRTPLRKLMSVVSDLAKHELLCSMHDRLTCFFSSAHEIRALFSESVSICPSVVPIRVVQS